MKYEHDDFKPTMNGDERTNAARNAGFVRVPIEVEHFTRDLTKAVWAYANEADIPARMALCIIHCAMRTLESCLKHVLTVMGERYLANRTSNKVCDRDIIDTHLNSRLWKDMSLRKLVSCDQKGNLNKVTLNGGEVRSAIYDLPDDASFLLAAIRTTYSKLADPVDPATIHLPEWEEVLRHWARAMRAAYTMRATREDRQTFRESTSYYVIAKATPVPAGLVWYDWQLFSLMPALFDRYESLMMISQEGMEAFQKLNNGLQRNSNNFSNAGRIQNKIKLSGIEAIKAYLLERLKKMKTPCQWIWEKQLLLFVSKFHDVLERVEGYRARGETITWAEFDDEWNYYMTTTRFCCRLVGRFKLYRRGGGEYGSQLKQALDDYYAPCACEENGSFWTMRPKDAAKLLRTQRRKRFMAAQKAKADLSPPPLRYTSDPIPEHAGWGLYLRQCAASLLFSARLRRP